jgi:quinol-cytochrome oxidoreductase complex cytochrome b subunit
MCIDCHGDQGQGLSDEWRLTFALEYHNCWESGCHGSDFDENSFEIPQTGAPAIAGSIYQSRFSNAFELKTYILNSMPLSPPDSLTSEQAWDLTAFVLSLNKRDLTGLKLTDVNASAIPTNLDVNIPKSIFPGVFVLCVALLLVGVRITARGKLSDEKKMGGAKRPSFYHHLHPPYIPAAQSRFRYTLGTGGIAVFLSLILLITGLLEMYYYVPTSDQAAESIQTMTTLIPFGDLIRNLHYWSAQFLVIVMTVHLSRVVLTGAYAPPRRFNYLLGIGLFVTILLLNFTGYVLRWDEGIRWALVVGTNLVKTIPWIGEGIYQFLIGGAEPSSATVTRFYAWHVFGLTLMVGILILWHIFRVRRDGGIAAPAREKPLKIQRISRFELVRREVLVMVIVSAFLLLFSLIMTAPIEAPLSTNGMSGDSQAPWFFLWIQQLLRLGDPFLWGVLVPVLVIFVLGLVPYVLPNARDEELGKWWPRGNRWAQILTSSIIIMILVLTVWGVIVN